MCYTLYGGYSTCHTRNNANTGTGSMALKSGKPTGRAINAGFVGNALGYGSNANERIRIFANVEPKQRLDGGIRIPKNTKQRIRNLTRRKRLSCWMLEKAAVSFVGRKMSPV